jgi:hypothetical protein
MLRGEDGRGPAVCACGTSRFGGEDGPQPVVLSVEDDPTADGQRIASVSGATLCDSPWLCPVCAVRQAGLRRDRVAAVTGVTIARGGLVLLVTLTVRHSRDMSLKAVKTAVADGSRSARAGKVWSRAGRSAGLIGSLVAPEVTFSHLNAWHYHQHLALAILPLAGEEKLSKRTSKKDREAREARALALGNLLIDRYIARLAKLGFDAQRDLQHCEIARSPEKAGAYVAKGADFTWEVAGSAMKDQTRKLHSMTPFDLLEKAAAGEAWALDRWREYAAEMKGVRSCIVTASLAEACGLDDEDDEAPSEPPEYRQVAGTIEGGTWNVLMGRRKANALLRLLEDVGLDRWSEVEAAADEWTRPKGWADDPIFQKYRDRQRPPPPQSWHPTDHEILSLVSVGSGGSTSSIVGSTWAALEAAAASRSLPLDCSQVRVMRLVTGLYGAL